MQKTKLFSDDFGYNHKVDLKLVRPIKKHQLTGVSILSTMVRRKELLLLKKTAKATKNKLSVGLHANLVEGKPVIKLAPSLLTNKGNFYPLLYFTIHILLRKISPKDIKKELTQQLLKIARKGIKVDIIDSHQHTHALSPVAEIVSEIAQEYNIPQIRSYKSIKNYTLKAKAAYLLLKIAAYVSHLVYFHNLDLPISWKTNNKTNWSFLSWENNTLDVTQNGDNKTIYVVHPYLGFDTNRSYEKII